MVWTQSCTERDNCEHAQENDTCEGRASEGMHAKVGQGFQLLPEAAREAQQSVGSPQGEPQHGRQEAGSSRGCERSPGPCPPRFGLPDSGTGSAFLSFCLSPVLR